MPRKPRKFDNLSMFVVKILSSNKIHTRVRLAGIAFFAVFLYNIKPTIFLIFYANLETFSIIKNILLPSFPQNFNLTGV